MVARSKPIFYRRRKSRMPIVALLGTAVFLGYLLLRRSDSKLSDWMQTLPSLYQWIPAAIMWAVLLVMLSVAMFSGKRED